MVQTMTVQVPSSLLSQEMKSDVCIVSPLSLVASRTTHDDRPPPPCQVTAGRHFFHHLASRAGRISAGMVSGMVQDFIAQLRAVTEGPPGEQVPGNFPTYTLQPKGRY